MLHRFFDTIRGMADASGFEAYYANIQRDGLSGAPTVEEAKKDYRLATRFPCGTAWPLSTW